VSARARRARHGAWRRRPSCRMSQIIALTAVKNEAAPLPGRPKKRAPEDRGSVDHRRKISLTVLSLHRNGIPVLPQFGGTRLP
jgi:hypothetical protein